MLGKAFRGLRPEFVKLNNICEYLLHLTDALDSCEGGVVAAFRFVTSHRAVYTKNLDELSEEASRCCG